VEKVFVSLKIVREAKGIKVDGAGNSPGNCHVKSSARRGGYRPRRQAYDDYGEKLLHADAEVGNTVKLEHSVNRAAGKETVGNQKWIKKEKAVNKEEKQTEPSPWRPNKKRMQPTETEAENEEEMKNNEEVNMEMPKSPPRQKRVASFEINL
jgi:hypothetical protein